MTEEERILRLENAYSTLNELAAKLPHRRNLTFEEARVELDKLVKKMRREKKRSKRKGK
jgi:hypothetical protein